MTWMPLNPTSAIHPLGGPVEPHFRRLDVSKALIRRWLSGEKSLQCRPWPFGRGPSRADAVPMFLRFKTRKKVDKLHPFWSVVDHRRVADGRVVQRQVLYLGEINDAQRCEKWPLSPHGFRPR